MIERSSRGSAQAHHPGKEARCGAAAGTAPQRLDRVGEWSLPVEQFAKRLTAPLASEARMTTHNN